MTHTWSQCTTPEGEVEISISYKPVSPPVAKYTNHKISFDVEDRLGARCTMTVWFAITDRRLARRIARREGMRFTKVGKHYEMRKR